MKEKGDRGKMVMVKKKKKNEGIKLL